MGKIRRFFSPGGLAPPTLPEIVTAIDVSSHQPRDLTNIIRIYQPDHVVVKLYLPEEYIASDYSLDQIASAIDNGRTVGGYVWGYSSSGPEKTIGSAVRLGRSAGIDFDAVLPADPFLGLPERRNVLWLDCETYTVRGVVMDRGPTAFWIRRARRECETLKVGLGLYTSKSWWQGYLSDTVEFSDLPLWTASYMDAPNIDGVPLYGSWTRAHGHQWTSNAVDRSVFRREVTIAA